MNSPYNNLLLKEMLDTLLDTKQVELNNANNEKIDKRSRSKSYSQDILDYLQKKRGYYTRPCLFNSISCALFG